MLEYSRSRAAAFRCAKIDLYSTIGGLLGFGLESWWLFLDFKDGTGAPSRPLGRVAFIARTGVARTSILRIRPRLRCRRPFATFSDRSIALRYTRRVDVLPATLEAVTREMPGSGPGALLVDARAGSDGGRVGKLLRLTRRR